MTLIGSDTAYGEKSFVMKNENGLFSDLPAGLLEDIIEKTAEVGEGLLSEFSQMLAKRSSMRAELREKGIVISEQALGLVSTPTTCATDGSYAIERLLSIDLVAAAAVVVEGITPPSEKRHWQEPRHETYVESEVHHADTGTILRALMLGNELLLAVKAPHDLVMLDGSLFLPTIYFNQAISKTTGSELKTAKEFLAKLENYLEAYSVVVAAERSDRQYIALPKYSTRREIGEVMGWPETHDDRALLTQILEPGELTKPIPVGTDEPWHIGLPANVQETLQPLTGNIINALKRVHVFYYKPNTWLPALRVELPQAIALNDSRLAVVVQGLRNQCTTGSMLEPYPIYLADRMVKALAHALPTFRQIATQRLAESYKGDISDVFHAMHGYRSESGV